MAIKPVKPGTKPGKKDVADTEPVEERDEARQTRRLASNHDEARQTRKIAMNHSEARQTRRLAGNHNASLQAR